MPTDCETPIASNNSSNNRASNSSTSSDVTSDECEHLLGAVKKEVKQIMEEAVTRKFVHEDSSSVIALCVAVDGCLAHRLKRRVLGLFKTNSTTALIQKISKTCPEAEQVLKLVDANARAETVCTSTQSQAQQTLMTRRGRLAWLKTALIERKLVKIIDHLTAHASSYYEKNALMCDYVCAQILASLLVGPCALDYSKMKTQDHYWTDPSADELVARHKLAASSHLHNNTCARHHTKVHCHCRHHHSRNTISSQQQQQQQYQDSASSSSSSSGVAAAATMTCATATAAITSATAAITSATATATATATAATTQSRPESPVCQRIDTQRKPLALSQSVKLITSSTSEPLCTCCPCSKCDTCATTMNTTCGCDTINSNNGNNQGHCVQATSDSSNGSMFGPKTSLSSSHNGYSFSYVPSLDHPNIGGSPATVPAAAATSTGGCNKSGLVTTPNCAATTHSVASTASVSSSTNSAWSPRMLHETLHQNARSSLLYAKNNVIMYTDGPHAQPMAGYLSLHQTSNMELIIKWIPNQMINGAPLHSHHTATPVRVSNTSPLAEHSTSGSGRGCGCGTMASVAGGTHDQQAEAVTQAPDVSEAPECEQLQSEPIECKSASSLTPNRSVTQSSSHSCDDDEHSTRNSHQNSNNNDNDNNNNDDNNDNNNVRNDDDNNNNNDNNNDNDEKSSVDGTTGDDETKTTESKQQQRPVVHHEAQSQQCQQQQQQQQFFANDVLPQNLDFYLNFVVSLYVNRIVYLHCHASDADDTESLVLVERDGTQRPPFKFPRGASMTLFLSCLEMALTQCGGRLEPPLWSTHGPTHHQHHAPLSAHINHNSIGGEPSPVGSACSPPSAPPLTTPATTAAAAAAAAASVIRSSSESAAHSGGGGGGGGGGLRSRLTPYFRRADTPTSQAGAGGLTQATRVVLAEHEHANGQRATPTDYVFRVITALDLESETSLSSDCGSEHASSTSQSVSTSQVWAGALRSWSVTRWTGLGQQSNNNSNSNNNGNGSSSSGSSSNSSTTTTTSGTTISTTAGAAAPTSVVASEKDTNEDNNNDLVTTESEQTPNNTDESIQSLCEAMRRQLISRTFYGWLSYCRHIKTIRVHLSGLVNHHSVCDDDHVRGANFVHGLTRDTWPRVCHNRQLVCQYVYQGGCADNELREQVWPYLLGHYEWGDDASERESKDHDARQRYEQAMREWRVMEATVRQRDREALAARQALNDSNNNNNNNNRSSSPTIGQQQRATTINATTSLESAPTASDYGAGDDHDDCLASLTSSTACDNVSDNDDSDINTNNNAKANDENKNDDTNNNKKRRLRYESTGSVGSDASLSDQFGCNMHRIDKDVQRCDRNYHYFARVENLDKLRNIMCTYVWLNLDVGYVQGMCDLAAPLLVIFDAHHESLSYECFALLMRRMVANFPHGGAMDKHFASMRHLLQVLDVELYELMQCNGDYTHFYFCYRWFLLDFKRELTYNDVFRVWETIWAAKYVATEHFVLFFALAIVKMYRDIILENNMDFTDTIKFFNEMAERHDADKILALAKDLVHQVQQLVTS